MDNVSYISEPIMLPTAHGMWVHATVPAEGNKFHSIMIYNQSSQGMTPPSKEGLKGYLQGHDGPLLTRIHSSCRFGETFHGSSCDCGPQLQSAMERIQEEGAGIILYMDQEGRGTDLLFKNKAVRLEQTQGLSTAHTFAALGLEQNDMRSYDSAIQILKDFGLQQLRLMTNNPKKLDPLKEAGLSVERYPLLVPPNTHSARYLEAKRAEMGHLLPAPERAEFSNRNMRSVLGYFGAAAVLATSVAMSDPAARLSAQSTFNGVAHLGGHVLQNIDLWQGLKNCFTLLTAGVCSIAILRQMQGRVLNLIGSPVEPKQL